MRGGAPAPVGTGLCYSAGGADETRAPQCRLEMIEVAMSEPTGAYRRLRAAIACEECRRWRRAVLVVLGLVALLWLTERLGVP